MSRLSLALLVTALTGCSLVIDGEVGDLEVNLNAKRDVEITLFDFDPHVGQRNDIAIVRPLDPVNEPLGDAQLEARAVIDPLPVPCFTVQFENGASFSANRVDFYADLNMDGVVSDPGDDHLWIRELELDEDTGEGSLRFIHDVMFDDLNDIEISRVGPDIELALTGLDAADGQLVVVTVSRQFRETLESPLQRTVVGIGVVGAVTGGMVNIRIPGILDAGSPHMIEVDFAEGTRNCRREVMAPLGASDTLTIDSLDPFDCQNDVGAGGRSIVFIDQTDAMCR